MQKKGFQYKLKDLETEVTAVIKIKDIKELYRLKDQISIKWWETGLVLLLFGSGFGFMLTISKLIPVSHPFVYWFSLFWIAAILLTLIGCIEFLIGKFRALRRLYEIHTRIMESLQKDLEDLKKRVSESGTPPEE